MMINCKSEIRSRPFTLIINNPFLFRANFYLLLFNIFFGIYVLLFIIIDMTITFSIATLMATLILSDPEKNKANANHFSSHI